MNMLQRIQLRILYISALIGLGQYAQADDCIAKLMKEVKRKIEELDPEDSLIEELRENEEEGSEE